MYRGAFSPSSSMLKHAQFMLSFLRNTQKYNAGDERRVATLSVLGWARVGRCTSTVQYLLHRTSTAAHSRPRSATVFAATHPRLTSLFLTLSPMVCCIRQRRLLQCLKGSSFGQLFVVVHYCRQPAATCLLYFNSPPSILFSCSLPQPYSLVLRCCCAAVTQRHLDSCSSTVRSRGSFPSGRRRKRAFCKLCISRFDLLAHDWIMQGTPA